MSGEAVKQEDIHAKYESGVLKLGIPKMEDKSRKLKKTGILRLKDKDVS